MNVSQLNFDHLRPPKAVFNILHSDEYILEIKGKEYIRRIFHNVQYTQHEKDKLADFEDLLESENITLPNEWTTVETMKFLYAGRLVPTKAISILKAHLEWRQTLSKVGPSDRCLRVLRNGAIYISGRDKEFRPIIIINADRIGYNASGIEDFTQAMCFVFSIAKEFYFVPGRVENWIVMVETGELGFEDVPFKVFKNLIEVTTNNFVCSLEKLYILNPSKNFKTSWSLVESMLDSVVSNKIIMISKAQYPLFHENISPEQLEERYGGTLTNPKIFWPPVNTYSKATSKTSVPAFRHEDTANTRDPGELTEGSKNLTSTAYLTMKDVELKLTKSTKTSVNHGSTIDWAAVKEPYNDSQKEYDDAGQSTNSKNESIGKRRSVTIGGVRSNSRDDIPSPGKQIKDWNYTQDYRGYREDEYEDDEGLEEEEEKEEWEEGKRVNVSSYQSIRKYSQYSHLSTVKEETYEEGLTSLMSQGTNGRKNNKAKSKRSLMSSVLLRNASEKLEKYGTYTGPQSNTNSGPSSGKDGSGHSKLKLGLSRAGFTDSLDIRSEMGSEDRYTNASVCCRWPGFGSPAPSISTQGSHSRNNQSCNIF